MFYFKFISWIFLSESQQYIFISNYFIYSSRVNLRIDIPPSYCEEWSGFDSKKKKRLEWRSTVISRSHSKHLRSIVNVDARSTHRLTEMWRKKIFGRRFILKISKVFEKISKGRGKPTNHGLKVVTRWNIKISRQNSREQVAPRPSVN